MNRTRRLLLRLTPAGQAGLVQGLVPECSSVPPLSAASERLMSNLAASTSSSGSAFAVVSASSLPWNWNFLTFAVLPVLALGASAATGPEVLADEAADVKSSGSNLIPLATRQRLFFKYEKRIRERSSLEKVFSYFSSHDQDGVRYMMPQDLLHALVPTYPPYESATERSGSLDGERVAPRRPASSAQLAFFRQFDMNGDDTLDYTEFLLVLTLLSIHEYDVKTIFDVVDLDDNGVVDVDEFRRIVDRLQAMANTARGTPKLSFTAPDGQLQGLLAHFFGVNGSKKLQVRDFSKFLARLHEELLKLEFGHYDEGGKGSLHPVDFARSLVVAASVQSVDGLLNKAETLPRDALRRRITYDEFAQVHALTRKMHTLTVALDFLAQGDGGISRSDFTKLLRKLLPHVHLSAPVLDVLFHMFGDARGDLDVALFLDVFVRRDAARKRKDSDQGASEGLFSTFSCIKECFAA